MKCKKNVGVVKEFEVLTFPVLKADIREGMKTFTAGRCPIARAFQRYLKKIGMKARVRVYNSYLLVSNRSGLYRYDASLLTLCLYERMQGGEAASWMAEFRLDKEVASESGDEYYA